MSTSVYVDVDVTPATVFQTLYGVGTAVSRPTDTFTTIRNMTTQETY